MTVEAFLDYVKQTKASNTFSSYKYGIQKFSEWFGKTPNEILEMRRQDWLSDDLHQKKRFMREIEKFHKWLREGEKDKNDNWIREPHTINSARNTCLGIMQLFRFYEMPVTIDTGSDVSKTVPSTKDYIPTPQDFREMYKVADDLRGKLITSMGKDLGWRIGDFSRLRKDILPNLDGEPPLPLDLITEKEDVLAKSFMSAETVEILKQWLPTLPKENPYLFPSNGSGHLDEETINRTIRELATKAEIKIPKNKRLRFHAFRKRFLTECANQSIDINIAKILCGKDVELSMLTYLSEVEHRKAFLKVQDVLNITGLEMRKTTKPTTELEKRVDELERLIHGIVAVGGREWVEKGKQVAKLENIMLKAKTAEETLSEIGEHQLKKQREEYKKLIESNNDNGNNH
jgi:integrase